VSERAPQTAVLIALPQLIEYTDRWRSTSGSPGRPDLALSRRIPPHVTVLVPWAPHHDPGLFERAVERLVRVVRAIGPLNLTFPTAGLFPGGTVWLRPEPFGKVLELVTKVLAAFPEYPAYGGIHPEPHPHVSVSSAGGPAVLAHVEAALKLAPPPPVRVEELTIWREDSTADAWHQVAAVRL
jgi:2'-5' RNA ligase superfamily protein